ncbi:R3H domain-containing protein [Seiridium cupressi]
MATAPASSSTGPVKMSFAKVAASGARDNRALRVAVPTMEHRRAPSTGAASAAKTTTSASVKGVSPTATVKTPVQASTLVDKLSQKESPHPTDTKITQKLNESSLSSDLPTPSLVVNGSSSSVGGSQSKNENGTHVSDDVSQRADSNSEIGAKAPSLDGKSITSGTTFALDEKESLRPDDSASVKAAAEDDESFSVRGSQMANSRMGSEVARIHRLRIGDMPERRIIQLLPESQDQGVATPQSVDSGIPPPTDASQSLGTVASTPDAFSTMYSQNPDDKLLEAMASPKDRIFLLRLEQDVINFVQSSKEPFMDLPPSNSFCRMLTHKLADYYHMTHSFEAVQGAVRIYRTPFCRVPLSLASIVGSKEPEGNATVAQPVLLPKKIMRRGEEAESGPASTSPSKATSEVGSDGKEKDKAKEKMTREQREEAYNKARERIFGTSDKTGESTPENEDANGTSRASSVSGKDKSNLGKRGKTGKQRRDDSESFDSRSQYTAWYNTHHYVGPQSAGSWQGQYASAGNNQFVGQVQQPYPNAMQQPYPQPAQNYPQMVQQSQMNAYPQYGPMQSFPAQPSQPIQQRYPSTGNSMPGYGSPIQNPQPQQVWSHPTYPQASPPGPAPYQQQTSRPAQPSTQQGIPYAFGQLPVNVNPNDPKSQHPIPGSYNRHAFNPKTQSFVPGTGMGPVQSQPSMPYNMAGPHGSPQIGSPHPSYPGYAPNGPPQPYMTAPVGYGMSRQSSNNSLPAYHPQATPPQHLPQHPGSHMPQMPQVGNPIPHQMTHPLPSKGPQPMNNTHPHFTSLPNYGNPATLPQKPPTGI